MALRKLLVWLVLALVALVLLSAVVTAVFAAIAFVWLLVRVAVTLAVIGALLYGGYKLYDLLNGGSSEPSLSTGSSTTGADYGQSHDPVEDIKRRYAEGEISESELERRLERQLDDGEFDSIDRELQRERS